MNRRGASVLVVGWLLSCAVLADAQVRSVWSGVYTTEQAVVGETLYYDQCASCHGDDLAGIERAPALVGGRFLEAWRGKTLRALVERIEEMPPDEPPVVTAQAAADVLAFLLWAADMPSGATSLPADRTELDRITFDRTKP